MKLLYILRHGKASGSAPDGGDSDRSLVAEGIRDAGRVGAECARRGWHPARALVSPAQRATMTYDFFDHAFRAGGGPPIIATEESALYLATPEDLHEQLALLDPGVPSALIVGHNPGVHALTFALAGPHLVPPFERLTLDFPTATLVALRCATDDWGDIAPQNTEIEGVIFARDLA